MQYYRTKGYPLGEVERFLPHLIVEAWQLRLPMDLWYLGGLGESISRIIVKNYPCPMEFIATEDTFGESGTPSQLMKKYGLDKDAIIRKVSILKNRK